MTKYKVTLRAGVYDYDPGEEFDADIPSEQEAFLVEGGFLEKVSKGSSKKKKDEEEDE